MKRRWLGSASTSAFDYDGKNGPPGHPDLKGFGANGASACGCVRAWRIVALHIGFVANSRKQVDRAYAAAIAAGATELYYDPPYYTASVTDPDGYSIEFVCKSWQHSEEE